MAPVSSTKPDTRERILQASVALFEQRGFRATSLAEIADAVGIKKASLYYHMPSKSHLLEAVFRHVTDSLIGEPRSKDLEVNLYPCQRLALEIGTYVRFHLDNRAFLRIFWRERHELPAETYVVVRQREDRYESYIADLIASGQEQGCFARDLDPVLMRYSALGMLTTVYRWPHPEEPTEAYKNTVVDHVTRALLHGLGGGCTHSPQVHS